MFLPCCSFLTSAAAQVQRHVTSLSAVTVSLPQAGARVADTRDAAKSAAEVAAAAVASVMKAKAELHRFASILLTFYFLPSHVSSLSRQDAASAAGRGVVDAYKVALRAAPLLPSIAHPFCRPTLPPKSRLLKQRQQVCVASAPTRRCLPHAPAQPRLPWWPGVCEIRARFLP